jgi:hypothetical protein
VTRVTGIALLLTAAALGASIALSRGGFIHPEAEVFIPHYLQSKPLPQIIFDPNHTDWGLYQARELSYLFDWLDCRVLAVSAACGLPHFLSLTHYAGAAFVALFLGWFARFAVGLPSSAALGLATLWLTSPAVFLGGSYYRSAKILVATTAVLAIGAAWRAYRDASMGRRNFAPLIVWCAALLAAGLADRQGAFLVTAGTVWLAARTWLFPDPHCRGLALAAAAATGAIFVYTYIVGPAFIRHAVGYSPSFEYLSLPWSDVLADMSRARTVFWYGPRAAFQALGYTWGALPWVLAAAVSCFLVHTNAGGSLTRPPDWRRALWFSAPLLGILVMYGAMALRHGAIVQLPDFIMLYYPLPVAAIALTGLAFLLRAIAASAPGLIVVILWLLVASNIGSLPHARYVRATGTYAAAIAAGPDARLALIGGTESSAHSPAIQALRAAADRNVRPAP